MQIISRHLGKGVLALAMVAAMALPVIADDGCAGEDGGAATVVEVVAGDTLLLEDGRALRLVAVLPPPRGGAGSVTAHHRGEMERALSGLVLGKTVAIRFGGRRRDRYGRLLAHVHVDGEDGRRWVQHELISAGLVRVSSFADNRACLRPLLDAEQQARSQGRGLWGAGLFRVRAAHDTRLLRGLSGTFQIVEGVVRSVAERRGRVFVNFDDNWRRDFTATIRPADRKAFAADAGWGIAEHTGGLPALTGRRVRVRGWLESRNGPLITVTHPEQIEVVGPPASAASAADAGG